MLAELDARAQTVRVPAGGFICMEGEACEMLPLVAAGTVRVFVQSDEGREVTLYRIQPGESCVLTASCLLGETAFPAFAVAETEVRAVVVRLADVQAWMHASEAWRGFVLGLIARRFAEVIGRMEDLMFRRLDARLAGYLLDAAVDGRVTRTHEQIATDLGSARAVVSRHLKALEQAGLVALDRSRVTIHDPSGLQALRRRG
ncbi:MAG: Crp/Fnr family transcriptional regulator [Bacteroidota bacterium]